MDIIILIVSSISLFVNFNYLIRVYKKVKDLLYKEIDPKIISKKLSIYSLFPFFVCFFMSFFTLVTSSLLLENQDISDNFYSVSFGILLSIVVVIEIIIFVYLSNFQRKFNLPYPNLKWNLASYFVPAVTLYTIWNIINAIVASFNY